MLLWRQLCPTTDYAASFSGLEIDVEGQLAYYRSIAKRVCDMTTDTIEYTNEQYDMGKKILIEGANATMLDIDFGTYPYVTSSNPSIGSMCLLGLGCVRRRFMGFMVLPRLIVPSWNVRVRKNLFVALSCCCCCNAHTAILPLHFMPSNKPTQYTHMTCI